MNRYDKVWKKKAPSSDRAFMRDKWYYRLVHPEGLEPSTNGLRGHCSTNWATGAWLKELYVWIYNEAEVKTKKSGKKSL